MALATLWNRYKRSVAARIHLRLLAGAGLLLAVFALCLGYIVEHQLRLVFDQALLGRAQALSANVEEEISGIEFDLPDGLMLGFDAPEHPDYFLLADLAGKILSESPSQSRQAWLMPPQDDRAVAFDSKQMPDGRPGRLVSIRFVPKLDQPDLEDSSSGAPRTAFPSGYQPNPVTLTLGTDDQPYHGLVRSFRVSLIVMSAAMLLAIAWLSSRTLAHGFAPIHEIRRQIAGLDARCLDKTITPAQTCSEMDDIVLQVNRLLERLQDSFDHERRFTQDVAHELRTPLSELRSMAEVSMRWPDEPALRNRFFDNVLDVIGQMQSLLGNLLALARAERELEMVDPEPFDLRELCDEVCRSFRKAAQRREVTLQMTGEESLKVNRGQDQWLQILRNLIGNALEYCPHGAVIRIHFERRNHEFSFVISNPQSHLDQGDLPYLFKRLWRKDASRSSGVHSGLGLALVQAYARQLDLELKAQLDSQQALVIRLSGQNPFNETSGNEQKIIRPAA